MEKTVIETTKTQPSGILDSDAKAIETAERVAMMINTINGMLDSKSVKALTVSPQTIQVSLYTCEENAA